MKTSLIGLVRARNLAARAEQQLSAWRWRRRREPEGFFHQYPTFLESSTAGASLSRLNKRFVAIIEANRDVIEGQRILDLASHDGRFSFAALTCGATHVTGIEARAHLVSSAIENMKYYGVPDDRYSFVVDDLFAAMRKFEPRQFNTVICAGFMYHTYRHEELLYEIKRLMPMTLIVDSKINASRKLVVEVHQDSTDKDWESIDDRMLNRSTVVVGWPSRSALEMMLNSFGFDVSYFDWSALARDGDPHVAIYRKGRRVTIRCTNRHHSPA